MEAIYLILLYLVFLFALLIINYYINLFSKKDNYSKSELKDFTPHFNNVLQTIKSKYSLSLFSFFFVVSSIIGTLVPFMSNHWIVNSSLLFIIIHFSLPFLKKSLEEKMVAGETYKDSFANTFVRNCEGITIGFGTGLAAALMYVWGDTKELSFLWLIINIGLIAFFMEMTLKSTLSTPE